MIFEIIKISILALFGIGVGYMILSTQHKETMLLILGISGLIFVLTRMKDETISMGEQ